MSRRRTDLLCAGLVVVVLTGFALLLVTGRYVADGPILLSLSDGLGLHEGDLLVAAGWAAGVAAVARLVRRGGPASGVRLSRRPQAVSRRGVGTAAGAVPSSTPVPGGVPERPVER